MDIKKIVRRWLFGKYIPVGTLTVNIEVIEYDKVVSQLENIEKRLDSINSKSDKTLSNLEALRDRGY